LQGLPDGHFARHRWRPAPSRGTGGTWGLRPVLVRGGAHESPVMTYLNPQKRNIIS
jgi:hypothetical protein